LANQYGSLTRGVLAARAQSRRDRHTVPLFRTLKGGLGQLVDAVVRAISGKVEVRRCRAQTIERAGAGFRIKLDDGGWLEADQVVVACEAHSGSALLAGVDGRLAELLGTVPYSSSMTVALGFDAADFAAQGHPAPRFRFPGAQKGAPAAGGLHLGRSQIPVPRAGGQSGGALLPGRHGGRGRTRESDEVIGPEVTRELQEIAGFTARPRFTRISRWPRSMAQVHRGPSAAAGGDASAHSAGWGIHLAGNAYEGIGIPDCIRMGRQAAERILGA